MLLHGLFLQKKEKPSLWQVLLRIFLGILTLVIGVAGTAVTLVVLLAMVVHMGNPTTTVQSTGISLAVMDKLDMFVTNEISDALDGVLSVKKRYWLHDEDQVAPEPDQSCFGQADDPAQLHWLLDAAAEILEGQELYFGTDTQIMKGSKVKYYLDETILAITWKEVHDYSVYTFSEVKIAHPSQFRRFLADGVYGSDKQYTTTEMAESVNAVVASSGDFHRFRSFGICVYEGQVKKVEGTYAETCYIDDKGDLLFTYGGDLTTTAKSQQFVDENNIRFSLCFGPILVDDYEVVDHTWYGVGEITEGYARAALCQMGELHYIVATANTEGPNQEIPTVRMFQRNIAATGCRMAYCLDGGQTAAIVMNDILINRPVYGTQRKISDIIYFATAIPEEE